MFLILKALTYSIISPLLSLHYNKPPPHNPTTPRKQENQLPQSINTIFPHRHPRKEYQLFIFQVPNPISTISSYLLTSRFPIPMSVSLYPHSHPNIPHKFLRPASPFVIIKPSLNHLPTFFTHHTTKKEKKKKNT
ncbi:hypothetical protein OCU04_000475 [Sclerotinia nivalis]|uniref:Uncharacterized protein n=1 Tax=Sclerotinia nivalis TaxID=352851 RepID=A0A9X0DPT0_9HELO|nr:hypothetical protein OCU04_000475 [Sclerotinia nivalis]